MLTTMRRHAKSWFIKIALGVIVIVFTFWGVGSYNSDRASRVAVVDGNTIQIAEYQRAYRQLIEQARANYGDRLNDELVKTLNLGKTAIDSLINKQLMLNAAEEEKVIITDQAVLNAIQNAQAFQINGKFSADAYRRVLAANRYEPTDYEKITREDLTIQRMKNRLTIASLVSDKEALDYYHWQNDQAKISYVAFNAGEYRDKVKITDAALEKQYQANKEAYRIPEMVTVQYLSFPVSDFMDKIKVDEAKVREIYEMTLESFAEPEQVKLRHILLKVDQGADEAKVAEIKAKAEELVKQIKDGADMAQLAKDNSASGDKDKGGELDWMPKGRLLPELNDAAFSMKKGELSGPIKTMAGWHILRLEDKKESRTKPFEEVRASIEKDMKKNEATELALTRAEEAYGLSAGATDLKALAAQIKAPFGQAGPFSRQDKLEGPTSDPKFLEAAFEQPEGEVGAVVEGKDAFYLVLVSKKNPSYVPDLGKVKAEVEKDYIQAESRRLAKAEADKFLGEVKNSKDWLGLTGKRLLNVQVPPAFKRNSPVEGLGFNFDLTEAAFELSTADPYPKQVFELGDKMIVFHYENRLPASDDVFKDQKDQIKAQLTQTRQQGLQAAWLNLLRGKAEIEIDKRFL